MVADEIIIIISAMADPQCTLQPKDSFVSKSSRKREEAIDANSMGDSIDDYLQFEGEDLTHAEPERQHFYAEDLLHSAQLHTEDLQKYVAATSSEEEHPLESG